MVENAGIVLEHPIQLFTFLNKKYFYCAYHLKFRVLVTLLQAM